MISSDDKFINFRVLGSIMEIRKAALKDKEALARLYMQFWKAHPGKDPLIVPKIKPNLGNQIKSAAKDIRKRSEYYFLAEEQGKVMGFIELCIKKNHKLFRIRKFGYISSVVVDNKFRGRGIAKKLVSFAAKFFRQKGIRYMRLNVYFSNKDAIKVWPKTGFKQESMFMLKKI